MTGVGARNDKRRENAKKRKGRKPEVKHIVRVRSRTADVGYRTSKKQISRCARNDGEGLWGGDSEIATHHSASVPAKHCHSARSRGIHGESICEGRSCDFAQDDLSRGAG
jgi:hypothetical protein